MNLRDRLPFELGKVIWFTAETAQSRSMLNGESVLFAVPAPPRDWRSAVANARLADAACRRLRFDAAISTGASMALSSLPVARTHGVDSYYIESAARVEGPSMTGRMLAAFPGVRTYCQYRSWSDRTWRFTGSVFDGFEPGPVVPDAVVRTAVVTLGTQPGYSFNRLVTRLHQVLPDHVDVLWQTGATNTETYGIEGRFSVPSAELDAAMSHADVVVAHAGVGSALSAIIAGRHPVLVARRSDFGEHVDDHQIQIAQELADRGLATACTPEELDISLLEDAARRTNTRVASPPPLML
ncbi:MAG: hypothetical protein M5U19_00645 [Microthrixaceae bacterium]|nr:hypothetical protein [Microthrixaceae bacterium]